jgi:hypothetical protein
MPNTKKARGMCKALSLNPQYCQKEKNYTRLKHTQKPLEATGVTDRILYKVVLTATTTKAETCILGGCGSPGDREDL